MQHVKLLNSCFFSWEKFSSVDWVSKRIQSFVAADYAGLLPLTDPLVSATLADFKGFPPVYISVGQCEVYHDQVSLLHSTLSLSSLALLQIVALSEKMRNAELIVELDEAQDMVHCYQFFSRFKLPQPIRSPLTSPIASTRRVPPAFFGSLCLQGSSPQVT